MATFQDNRLMSPPASIPSFKIRLLTKFLSRGYVNIEAARPNAARPPGSHQHCLIVKGQRRIHVLIIRYVNVRTQLQGFGPGFMHRVARRDPHIMVIDVPVQVWAVGTEDQFQPVVSYPEARLDRRAVQLENVD